MSHLGKQNLKLLPDAHAKCSHYLPSDEFVLSTYLERTRRNHFWVGGETGQMKLHKIKVGVAGLGGMGSNISEVLVRLGVGELRIADPDKIERSNVNRQVIANERTIGKSKAAVSAYELRSIANDFDLIVYDQGIIEEMVDEFVEGCDVIVDEIDVAPLNAHVLLHRAARKRGIPIYSAYVVGLGTHFYKFEGESYTFEDFISLKNSQMDCPSIDDLVKIFGSPLPSYLEGDTMDAMKMESVESGIPIFGPATLLGHAIVSMRIILDYSIEWNTLNQIERTPVMPEFLVLDGADIVFKRVRV